MFALAVVPCVCMHVQYVHVRRVHGSRDTYALAGRYRVSVEPKGESTRETTFQRERGRERERERENASEPGRKGGNERTKDRVRASSGMKRTDGIYKKVLSPARSRVLTPPSHARPHRKRVTNATCTLHSRAPFLSPRRCRSLLLLFDRPSIFIPTTIHGGIIIFIVRPVGSVRGVSSPRPCCLHPANRSSCDQPFWSMRRLRVCSPSLSLVTFGCVGAPYVDAARESVLRKVGGGCEANEGEPSRTGLGQYFPKFFPNLGTTDQPEAGDLRFRPRYLTRVP